jgi:hypothetical protein
VGKHAIGTFVANPLVRIYQKEKIAAKSRSCNQPALEPQNVKFIGEHIGYISRKLRPTSSNCMAEKESPDNKDHAKG